MGVGSVFVGFFGMMGLLLMSFPIAVIMVVLGVIGGVIVYRDAVSHTTGTYMASFGPELVERILGAVGR